MAILYNATAIELSVLHQRAALGTPATISTARIPKKLVVRLVVVVLYTSAPSSAQQAFIFGPLKWQYDDCGVSRSILDMIVGRVQHVTVSTMHDGHRSLDERLLMIMINGSFIHVANRKI